jgi:5'-nucleotidase
VVSAGQYGTNLNKLVFTVNTATGRVAAKTQSILPLKSCANSTACTNYPADSATASIVSAAVSNAAVLGAQPLGQIGGPFFRAKLADGSTENRGAESALGNLVAEVQKWNTRGAESGAAQIAFMNPGGLRQDMTGTGTGAFPRTLTYKQAADVQPFANTLVNMDLTGAQIKTVLEQQWQPVGAARPFLKLGISKGFTYTFDDSKPVGSRITGIWLDGTPIAPATLYSVTVNSFLAAGGDGFLELANGTGKQDTGKTDLQGMVDYMAAFGTSPSSVPVDYKQNGVGITFAAGEPASYKPGDHVKFDVSSWAMTNTLDAKDANIVVKAGATTLGTFPVNNAAQAALPGFDTAGKASVDVIVPNGTAPATLTLTLSGATTGSSTTVTVPIIKGGTSVSAPDQKIQYGQTAPIAVNISGTGATPSGTVELVEGTTSLGTASLAGGSATITVPRLAVAPGTHTITVRYLGDASHDPAEGTMTLTVEQSASSVDATVVPKKPKVGKKVKVEVSVHGDNGVAPTGQVTVIVKGGTAVTATLVNGVATVNLGKFTKKGEKLITVQYLGNLGLDVSQTMMFVTVKKK